MTMKNSQKKATYSKNISKMCLIAPCQISSFSAASFPIVNRTEMNSTIWNGKRKMLNSGQNTQATNPPF